MIKILELPRVEGHWTNKTIQIYAERRKTVKILYEMTYATRGQSGIPRDTIALGQILINSESIQSDFLLNPKSYIRRKRASNQVSHWVPNELGDALRREPGRSAIPPVFISALIFFQSLSVRRTITKLKLDSRQVKNTFDFLKLKVGEHKNDENRGYLLSLSYLARFARPSFMMPFKIKTSEYDFFIQQQVDPIQVSKKTRHIIRLHDFLPISHPQFFDQNAVKVFAKSLRLMLKGESKTWVMDSYQTAEAFKANFGENLDVRVIPCTVKVNLSGFSESYLRKNQICMINTIEPRKRVSLAIAGFKEAKARGLISEDWELLIVGNEGWQETSLVGNLKKQLFGTDVCFLEGAPDFEVERVYAESKIVLSASAAEGFGLPPLEGMSYGCVPVISDIPQHRETVGDFGFYFAGDHPKSVAYKIGEAVNALDGKELSIARRLIQHVQDNYSEQVISRLWGDLLNSK
jgi:glycosyltransferase involved in cell wall biosynthesis